MKVLIVEDEIVPAKQLTKMLAELDRSVEILGILDSILETTNFLSINKPDLIFLDIHLSDGMCFELFERMDIETPIIFTTAYDEYMQRAFKVNSVDYLLKPIRPRELSDSLAKYKKYNHNKLNRYQLNELLVNYLKDKQAYKCRFLVKSGRYFVSISIHDVAYIISENKLTYIVNHDGKRYLTNYSLDQMEQQLDPEEFIKINRNYVISNKSIVKFEPYFNNRMLVQLMPTTKEDVLVSRSYLNRFRKWLEK